MLYLIGKYVTFSRQFLNALGVFEATQDYMICERGSGAIQVVFKNAVLYIPGTRGLDKHFAKLPTANNPNPYVYR
jgi:hypothetical protein